MKTNLTFLLLFTCGMVSTQAIAASDTANVNVTATVVDNTCTPVWSSGDIIVDMNRVSKQDFGADKIGATKTFDLSLTDCGEDTTRVKVTASGNPSIDSGLFANMINEGASGVGVGIWGGAEFSTQLMPNGSTSAFYNVNNGEVNMSFLAKLIQVGDTAPSAGEVKSAITLTVDYE